MGDKLDTACAEAIALGSIWAGTIGLFMLVAFIGVMTEPEPAQSDSTPITTPSPSLQTNTGKTKEVVIGSPLQWAAFTLIGEAE